MKAQGGQGEAGVLLRLTSGPFVMETGLKWKVWVSNQIGSKKIINKNERVNPAKSLSTY